MVPSSSLLTGRQAARSVDPIWCQIGSLLDAFTPQERAPAANRSMTNITAPPTLIQAPAFSCWNAPNHQASPIRSQPPSIRFQHKEKRDEKLIPPAKFCE
jgi:hypothetical protein